MKIFSLTVALMFVWQTCTACLTPATSWLHGSQSGITRKDSIKLIYHLVTGKQYDEALNMLWPLLEQELNQPSPDPKNLNYFYNNMGICYKNQWKYEEAINAYNNALKFSLKIYGHSSAYTASIYNNLGNLYNTTGEYHTAALYLQNALEIYNRLVPAVPAEESRVLNNLGQNASLMGNHHRAYEFTLKSIEKRKQAGERNLGIPYHSLANILVQLERYEEAEEYFRLSVNHLSSASKPAGQDLVMAYLSYGLFLTDRVGAKEEGKNIYLKALSISRQHLGEKNPTTAQAWTNLAGIYGLQEKYDSALYCYQQALIALAEDFADLDITRNPSLEEVRHLPGFLSTIRRKAATLKSLSEKTGDIRCLEWSIQTYELAIEGIEKLRNQFQTEESKLFLADNARETYYGAITSALEHYRLTGLRASLEKAYAFTERSKASVLISSLQNMEALETGGIPEEVRLAELNLKREIARNQELLYEEEKKADPDTSWISEQKQVILDLVRQQDSLIGELERSYPEYYALKYGHEVPSVRDIQEMLDRREVILEYVLGEEELITFCIAPDDFAFHVKPLKDAFDEAFGEMHRLLTGCNFNDSVRYEYNRFLKASHTLYRYLIEPFAPEIEDRHLIIIADSRLHFLPFEILIRETPASKRVDYHSLPYLFAENPVSYAHSAMLLKKAYRNRKGWTNSLIAYAPDYEPEGQSPALQAQTRQYYRDRLLPIPGALEEVQRIGKCLGGDVFTGNTATEKHFKEHAGKYDLIHLAMHTIIDDTDPMFSKLAFTDKPGNEEDGLLNTFEIYNLRLNARLTTLSSCNSGIGELHEGEGMISLARGFMYAGCPSLVLSLWEVEDLASADLMEYFYTGLKRGLSKARALQYAKLRYLEEADMLHSHPYFWSGYVVTGNHGPVYYGRQWFIIAGALIASIIVFALCRRRFSPRRKPDRF
ncbi:MAG: CHAT domain-containing protein [Bacteroidales bacterium]